LEKKRKERERNVYEERRKDAENSRRLNQMNHQSSFIYFFQFYNNNGYFSQRHKGIYNKFKLFLSKEILLK
jgi:hypothetical protein